ncbi:MAG TPA: hypothetical protein VK466_07095, partial [Terriglobales bacterium]|nr:hypothetical protein [Terriglobales bacterium]
MKLRIVSFCFACVLLPLSWLTSAAQSAASGPVAAAAAGGDALPYRPSFDAAAMDKAADPCVDFYQYSCGGWMKSNPIPPDRTSWGRYAQLYEDNL